MQHPVAVEDNFGGGEINRVDAASAEGWLTLAENFAKHQKIEQAIEACRAATRIKTDYSAAYLTLAKLLKGCAQFEEAAKAADEAIRVRPDEPAAYFERAEALRLKGDLDEAKSAYIQTIQLKAEHHEAILNLANLLYEQHDFFEAIAWYRRAIEVKSDFVLAYSNLSNALRVIGRLPEAITAARAAIVLKPDHAEAHYNLSLALLASGQYGEGWQEYEWRWRGGSRHLPSRDFSCPRWRGEPLRGRRLLLHAEQGLGDTLQFARFVPIVAERGPVLLAVQPPLVQFFKQLCFSNVEISDGQRLVGVEVELPLMSVPWVLGTEKTTVPDKVPYLIANADRVADWRGRLPQEGFRIGISWRGRPNVPSDRGRSFALRSLAPLAKVLGTHLISLQKGCGVEELTSVPTSMPVEILVPELDPGPDAFLDTAAVITNLDLVVTADTSLAHLAGALGRPVWIALQKIPDWRWGVDGESSPWYPTARLFRQRDYGMWDEVFERMASELALGVCGARDRLMVAPRSITCSGVQPLVPVSVGELIDKITILEIKCVRVTDRVKRANVEKELELLRAVRGQHCLSSGEIVRLANELAQVNVLLWEIENQIRHCERDGDFGCRFVELARSVYKHNDRRASLKRQINELTRSSLLEEKSY